MSRFVKNSLANLIRGGATAIVSLALPAILKRYFNDDLTFSLWALILQLAAYIGLFNFGIETAVARFVAHYHAQNDAKSCQSICSSAFFILCGAMLVALLLLSIGTAALPAIYGDEISAQRMHEMQISLFCIGTALALGLPVSAMSAIFIGLQRNIVPTVIIGSTRILTVLSIFIVVQFSPTLIAASITYAIMNILATLWQYIAYRTQQNSVRIHWKKTSKSAESELYHYCVSLMIWSVAMIFVNGMDLIILSQFNLKAVAYFSVAANLVAFIAGLQQAIFSPLIARGAELSAQPNSGQVVGELLLSSTRYASLILWVTGLPLIIFAEPIFKVWMGGNYPEIASPILIILVIANIVRMLCAPYSFLLVATGEQQKVLLTPFLEGITNLVFSILLCWKLGAIGVAYGTLIGSVIGALSNILMNIPKTQHKIMTTRKDFISVLFKQNKYFLLFFSSYMILSACFYTTHLFVISSSAILLCAIFWLHLNSQEKTILRKKLHLPSKSIT